MNSESAISVRDLSKRYRLGATISHDTLRDSVADGMRALWHRLRRGSAGADTGGAEKAGGVDELWALRDVSFDIPRGEVIGIIGRNGAGKSTLLKILSRITEPTAGEVRIRGRIASLLEVGTGFHPELSGRENILLNGAILGMHRHEILRKFDEIVAFSGVERFIDTPVKRYSSGMYVRLAFAVAAHLEPEILLVDEVLAVGDADFQKKCLGKMGEVARGGRTVLLVSHNMHSVRALCTSALLFDSGRLKENGPAGAVVDQYIQKNIGSHAVDEWAPQAAAEAGTDGLRVERVYLRADGDLEAGILSGSAFHLCLDYTIEQPDVSCFFYFRLDTFSEQLVMLSANTESISLTPDPYSHEPYQPGRYTTSCEIPGFFLNPGQYSLSVFACRESLHQKIFEQRNILCIRIVDDGSMRKEYYNGPWDAIVRPRLPWTTSPVAGREGDE